MKATVETQNPLPPVGYRLLQPGETIRKGDMYCRGEGHSWHETAHPGGKWNRHGYWPMARKVTSVVNGTEEHLAPPGKQKAVDHRHP